MTNRSLHSQHPRAWLLKTSGRNERKGKKTECSATTQTTAEEKSICSSSIETDRETEVIVAAEDQADGQSRQQQQCVYKKTSKFRNNM